MAWDRGWMGRRVWTPGEGRLGGLRWGTPGAHYAWGEVHCSLTLGAGGRLLLPCGLGQGLRLPELQFLKLQNAGNDNTWPHSLCESQIRYVTVLWKF